MQVAVHTSEDAAILARLPRKAFYHYYVADKWDAELMSIRVGRSLSRQYLCSHCAGTGDDSSIVFEDCPYCDGTGYEDTDHDGPATDA